MMKMMNRRKVLSLVVLLIFITLPVLVHSECTCDIDEETETGKTKTEALKHKFIAIASILVFGAIGVCIPILGNLNPDKYTFILIKAFAAGVIFSTGCMHVLADAIENLNSPCLNQDTWGYPWANFIMMMSVLVTFMLDKFAVSYYNRSQLMNNNTNKEVEEVGLPVSIDQEQVGGEHATTTTHGHSHGSVLLSSDADNALLRHRIVSHVLELGIVVHSVIIGVGLGTSRSPSTIKPLIAALTFHQFFEGLGLGGSISQAELKKMSVSIMAVFFSLTTPIGIGIGIGISNVYNENSPTSLIVEGVLNAVSSGILICMALVDLLAADFENPKLQSNGRLQIFAFIAVFLGASCMALLAKWA